MSNLIMMIIFNFRGLSMTREEAKRRAELYSALAEGKIIQFKQENGEWTDLKIDLMCGIAESSKYRIKPEPKYRPFKSQEECWQEMLKHQPFGWIRNKVNRAMINIAFALGGYVMLATENRGFSDVFDKFEFIDGTPFGIKIE